MDTKGTITIIDYDLFYGFIKSAANEEIFFSKDSEITGCEFSNLKIGDKVQLTYKETPRGPFAMRFTLSTYKEKAPRSQKPTEASI